MTLPEYSPHNQLEERYVHLFLDLISDGGMRGNHDPLHPLDVHAEVVLGGSYTNAIVQFELRKIVDPIQRMVNVDVDKLLLARQHPGLSFLVGFDPTSRLFYSAPTSEVLRNIEERRRVPKETAQVKLNDALDTRAVRAICDSALALQKFLSPAAQRGFARLSERGILAPLPPSQLLVQNPQHFDNPGAPVVHTAMWESVPDFDAVFETRCADLREAIKRTDLEKARHIFWSLLYFTGYRELWGPRLALSNELLPLSAGQGDQVGLGLITVKAIAYAHLQEGRLGDARVSIAAAGKVFDRERYSRGLAIVSEYMADVEVAAGNWVGAIGLYSEAAKEAQSIERFRVMLKSQECLLVHEPCDVSKLDDRLRQLEKLQGEYRDIGDYRALTLEIDIARLIGKMGDLTLARQRATGAVRAFESKPRIPRFAMRARTLMRELNPPGTST